MKKLLEKIKTMRTNAGYSHDNMAVELGLSQVSYTKIENGTNKLSVERLYQIAQILDVSVGELLDIEQKINLTQTNKHSATGYLQKIDAYHTDSKEAYKQVIDSKDEQIKLLKQLIDLKK